jgi:hypothetical protein
VNANANAPYCHLWTLRVYNNFPHYLINGTIFGKKVTEHKNVYWIYLLPSTQQTVGYNGFTTTSFDSHESSSGYVQNLLVLAVLLLTLLEVVGRYEAVAVLTLI